MDPLRNPKDPLRNTSEAGQELFRKMSACADGFPADVVITAALNVFIGALRQSHKRRELAERAFDERATRAKSCLLDEHYDGLGNRRNVFPFTQTINVGPPTR